MDKSTHVANYYIGLIGSPAKDIVVHHTWFKLCYGIPQEVTVSSSSSSATDQLYSDVVCN